MCGIFGILTNQTDYPIYERVLKALTQLQNRGYDSSGIGVLLENHIHIEKYASDPQQTSIDKLAHAYYTNPDLAKATSIGIGHNRWATHGYKNDINSHPHASQDKQFMIVHNGIIENYQVLKDFLITKGYTFISQTDTEVIVNLISFYYQECSNTFQSIKNTIQQLNGTYGIIVVDKNDPDRLYAVRNGSPLLIGISEEMVLISSEQSGFCGEISRYIALTNDDICCIYKNNKGIHVTTKDNYIEKDVSVDFIYQDSPSPYNHWTMKEIQEQPETILNSLNRGARIKNTSEVKLGGLDQYAGELLNAQHIILLGCGTSHHAGQIGVYLLKRLCDFVSIQVYDGADFTEYDVPKKGNTLLVFISQSGETKDLHRCIEIAKKYELLTLGITNVIDSLIARETLCGIYCNSGKEVGVASTKVFTSQVVTLSLLALWYSQNQNIHRQLRVNIISDLQNLSNDYKNVLNTVDTAIQPLVEEFYNKNHLFILGKGVDEYIAKEGALKIKEISYIFAEAYSSSSLKHGTFALLEEEFPVLLIDTELEHYEKNKNCMEEILSRGSNIFLITTNTEHKPRDNVLVIPLISNPSFSFLLSVIPLQLLAYYLSVKKNINPDIPRNLAKVVTVE